MKHRYLPMTEQDRSEMLAEIGIQSVEELFADIPGAIRYKGRLPMSEALDEYALLRHMKRLAGKNADFDSHTSFLGAGLYDHHIPVVINHVISRSEFYTAYTPYQPEISQGELQAIFEFQSYICELTGMKVANASMYDGATALGEAAVLASAHTKRKKIVVSRAVHPESRQVLATSAAGLGLEVVEIGCDDGVTDLSLLERAIDADTAAVLVQYPNFFGCIEDLGAISGLAHAAKALFVVSANPLALGVLETPGKLGADIVVGDAQPLGINASLGGPTCGYFAVAEPLMRKIPGRIVGQTVDRHGKRGFVLTLQAREQHIRREKATSNICSNQALLALCASVYLSVMGKEGMKEVGGLNIRKSHYAASRLGQIQGAALAFASPYFNEFVLKLPEGSDLNTINSRLLGEGFLGGYDLGRDYPELAGHLLIAVTEKRSKSEIDEFANALEGCL